MAGGILITSPPQAGEAQIQNPGQRPSTDLSYIGANLLVGGLTAGVASAIRGRSILKGFAQGAFGGTVSYLGKRVTAEDMPGAGLIGRQIGAIGASVVRSAAFGSGLLVDTLVMPIGPVRAYVSLLDIRNTRFRVDLQEIAWLAYNLGQPNQTLDLGASLSSGSFVFTSVEEIRGFGDIATGRAAPGVLVVRLTGNGQIPPDVIAHERVHVNQFDYLKITAGLPLEGAVRRGLGADSVEFLDRFDFGVGQYPFQWVLTGAWLPRSRQLFEIEAEYLENP